MSCRAGLLVLILLVTVVQKSTGTSWICPTGSIFCYQRLEPETWDNSYGQCIQKGGELPALDHQAYLEDWLLGSDTTYSWLSLKWINRRFQWMNITPLYWEYSKKQFANGHPLPQHECVRANQTVLFETTSCQDKNYAMCVIRARNREKIEAALELPEDSFHVVLKVRSKNTSIISDYLRVTREDFSTVQLHCVVEASETSLPRRPKFVSWLKDGVYLHLKPQMLHVATVYDRTKQSSASVGANSHYSQQGTYACEVVQLGNTTRTRSNTTLITLTESLNQILVVRHRSASLTLDSFMDSIKKFYKQVLQNEAKGYFDVSHAVEKLNWDCLVERQVSVNNSTSVAWNITVYIDVGEDKSNYGAAIAWFAGWNGTAAFQQWLAIQNPARVGFRGAGLSLTILYAEWCQSTSMQINETRLTWGTTIPATVASEPLCLNVKNQPVSRFCYPNYFYGAAWTRFPSQDCKKYKYSNTAFCPMGYQEGNRGCFRLTEQHAWEAAMGECFGNYPNGHSDQFGFMDWLAAAASNMSLENTPQFIWLPARRYTRYGQLYISFLWKKPMAFPENLSQLKFVDTQQHNKTAAMCLALDRRLNYLRMLDCSSQLPAVCLTKQFVKTSVTTTIKPFQCPLNWFSHRVIPMQSTCFKRFQSVEALTWDQARNNCVAAGASLVHINDSMLQIVVGQVYAFGDGESPNNLPAWIGLRRVNDNGKYCWHYGNAELNSTECSSNGYENWTPLSLENDFVNGYGVYIDTFGQWRPLPATITLRSYICQMEVRSSVKHSLHIHKKSQNLYEVKLKENVPNFKAQPINASLNFKDLIEIHNTKSQQTSKAPKSFTGNILLPYCFLDGMFQDSYTESVPMFVNKTGLLTCYMWLESPRVLIRSNTEYAKLDGRHVYIAQSVMRNDTYNSTLHDATWQQSLYGTQYGKIISGEITSRVQRKASTTIGKEIKISVKILGFFPYDNTSLGIDYRIEGQIINGASTPVLTSLQQDVQLLQLLRDALLKSNSNKQTAPAKNVKNYNNNLEYMYVRSIDYCSAITTTLQQGEDESTISWDRPESLTWDFTGVGVTTYAKELCVDPTGHILLRRCEDDLQTGADWSSIQVGDRLLEEPIGQEICSEPSETTVRLWNLVQNKSESGSTADSDPLKDLLNITHSWNPQTVDVKLSALALRTALKSHQVVGAMQFNQSVAILDNVIKVDAEQLATTQRLLNASNNFITALEDVQNRAVIEAGDSSIRATSEFILVEAYDVSNDLIGYEANLKTTDDTFQYANIETRPLYKSSLQDSAPEALLSDAYVAVLLPDSILNHSSTNASQRVSFSILQDGRFLEASALTNESETMSIYQFNYSHPKQYETSAGYRYNSPIAQINVRGISEDMPLSAPISAAFRPTLRNKKPICVSWQKLLNGNVGGWSPDKCRYVGRRDGLDVCQCSHLSFYAELFNVYDENLALENEVHATTLNIITIVGCSLSLIGLVCVVLTFLLFPEWRKSTGNKVLFNLALSLLGFLAVFLAGFDLTSERQLCKYVAIALHYFLLVSFAWMLIEAIHQYYRLVKYMGTYIARFMWKTTPFAWVLPILPVMAVLLYDHDDIIYRNNPRCWIRKDAFYPAVLAPISAILVVNIAVFALIIRSVVCCRAKLRTNQPHNRLVLQQFNMSVCVFFLLGLSWVFGFMTVNDTGIFFTYLFCIFNSLQGFFIFVFFVLRERNARQLWGDLWYGRDSRKNGANQMIALSSGNRSQSRIPDTHSRHTRI